MNLQMKNMPKETKINAIIYLFNTYVLFMTTRMEIMKNILVGSFCIYFFIHMYLYIVWNDSCHICFPIPNIKWKIKMEPLSMVAKLKTLIDYYKGYKILTLIEL